MCSKIEGRDRVSKIIKGNQFPCHLILSENVFKYIFIVLLNVNQHRLPLRQKVHCLIMPNTKNYNFSNQAAFATLKIVNMALEFLWNTQ